MEEKMKAVYVAKDGKAFLDKEKCKKSIDLGSITMLEAELKSYQKYPERPDVPELLKD